MVLWLLASAAESGPVQATLLETVIVAMLLSSALVCYATRGRHPGWIGLLGVAVLGWLGRAA